jgi:hypothetical protein
LDSLAGCLSFLLHKKERHSYQHNWQKGFEIVYEQYTKLYLFPSYNSLLYFLEIQEAMCHLRIKRPRLNVKLLSFDDVGHVGYHGGVLLPFLEQGLEDFALGFAVDDVDFAGPRLLEALDAVNGLYEVVELVADAEKDGFVAVALEVAAGSGYDGLGAEVLEFAVAEFDDLAFADVDVLRAVDGNTAGQGPGDGVTFGFEVVPDDEVVAGGGGDDVLHFADAVVEAVALFGPGPEMGG